MAKLAQTAETMIAITCLVMNSGETATPFYCLVFASVDALTTQLSGECVSLYRNVKQGLAESPCL